MDERTEVFTRSGGIPDPGLETLLKEERDVAFKKGRESEYPRAAVSDGRKAEPRRPQSLYELAQESFDKSGCYGSGETAEFMQELTKVFYERHIRTVESNLRDALESGKRAADALNRLKAVKPGP